MRVRWTTDALAVIRSDATLTAVPATWDAAGAEEVLTAVTKRFHRLPVFPLTTEHEPRDVPLWVHEVIQGYVFPLEDTPGFIAGRIAHAAEQYAEQMLPPFFEAPRRLEDGHRCSWHTPAHAGGCRVPQVAGGPGVLRLLRRFPRHHRPPGPSTWCPSATASACPGRSPPKPSPRRPYAAGRRTIRSPTGRPAHGDALPMAAGQVARPAVEVVLQAERAGGLLDPLADLRLGHIVDGTSAVRIHLADPAGTTSATAPPQTDIPARASSRDRYVECVRARPMTTR
ncbi:hypothetical protein Airi02_101040 [Actinoallomurus iriomotensis]|uniref:Orn/Lys/Arg decarboxylase N-terminal domain-containing protein n=1 Tax=Actinoallomurus iriomotensis TaxID=478107 RepID=A0A9W6SEM9_9ACTN|nr:hypothetical protein Airi02_101040 [Actinoallomurus iriomotensis]